MNSRRNFLKLAGAGTIGLPLTRIFGNSLFQNKHEDKLNVLFMSIEDSSPRRYGCYGNTICKTPNIDRFASGGLQFNLANSSCPVCNPSRTALYTGIRPESSGVTQNGDDWRKMLPDVKTIPELFREDGYETVSCGKSFHGLWPADNAWSKEIPENFDLPPVGKSPRMPVGPDVDFMRVKSIAREKGYNVRGGSPFVWGPTGLDDEEERDGRIAIQAIRYLEEQHENPFFLNLGFHAPHLRFTAPDKYFEMYNPDDIVLPDNPPDDLDDTPFYSGPHSDQLKIGEDYWRQAIAAHYATISFVDAQIGKVLRALESSRYSDNTIVVIWTDHGYGLGEHFYWRKSYLFEESVRVVLLMDVPGVTSPNSVCDEPVESVDILPTLMDCCGLPVPAAVEGESMKEILRNPQQQWKNGAVTVLPGGGGISFRTKKWRYNEYRNPEHGELYDHELDPGEYKNLFSLPEYSAIVQELSGELRKYWDKLGRS